MKTAFITLILSLAINSLLAQITFEKTYGGPDPEGNCYVTGTNDGGYVIVGSTTSYGAGDYDVYLVRTDAEGNVLWSKTYGGTADDMGYDVKQTNDSGFIITGSTESFGASVGYSDLYLIRTDKDGDTLWTRTYGGSGNETGWSVQQTTDSGFIAVGNWAGTGYLYTVRTDRNGDTLWTTINDAGYGAGVVQNADKGFTMCGTGYTEQDNNEMFLCRTDSLGNVLWDRTYGGTNAEGCYGLAKGNDGGFIIIGFTASFAPVTVNNLYIVKTDSAGNVAWSKSYGAVGSIQGYSVVSTGDGYALYGNELFGNGTDHAGVLIKIDNLGNVLWGKNYSSILVGNVKEAADGGYILTGYANNGVSGLPDWYVIKTDSMGNSGCSDSAATIIADTAATLVTVITPNPMGGTIVGNTATIISTGDTAATSVICISTGLENVANCSPSVTVFPNPAWDHLDISADPAFGQIKSVDFYNMIGQHTLITADTKNINVAELPAGVYIIKIANTAGVTNTVRFEKL